MNHPPNNGGVSTQSWQEVRRLWPNWNLWEFFGAAKLAHWNPLCIIMFGGQLTFDCILFVSVLAFCYVWLFSWLYTSISQKRIGSLAFLKKAWSFHLVLSFMFVWDCTVFCRNMTVLAFCYVPYNAGPF